MYFKKVKGIKTAEYLLWCSMKSRCRVQYENCTISDNFMNFQYFAEWCQHQVGFKVAGFQLDKDILAGDCLEYNENTCVFVPRKLNCFITTYYSNTKSGVIFIAKLNKFRARIQDLDGKRIHLGLFQTEAEAFSAYKTAKENLCKQLAEKYNNCVDGRVLTRLRELEIKSVNKPRSLDK